MPESAPRWCRHEPKDHDRAPTGAAAPAAMMGSIPRPVAVLARGEGGDVWDVDGTEYLDFLAGIAVNALGHAHPVFVDAVSQQAATLAHVSQLLRLPARRSSSPSGCCASPAPAIAVACSSATRAPRRSRRRSSWPGSPGAHAHPRAGGRLPRPHHGLARRSPARPPCVSRSCR